MCPCTWKNVAIRMWKTLRIICQVEKKRISLSILIEMFHLGFLGTTSSRSAFWSQHTGFYNLQAKSKRKPSILSHHKWHWGERNIVDLQSKNIQCMWLRLCTKDSLIDIMWVHFCAKMIMGLFKHITITGALRHFILLCIVELCHYLFAFWSSV